MQGFPKARAGKSCFFCLGGVVWIKLSKNSSPIKLYHMNDTPDFSSESSTDNYNPAQNVSDKLKLLREIAPYRKSSFSIFQEFFVSIDKILILGARLSTRL